MTKEPPRNNRIRFERFLNCEKTRAHEQSYPAGLNIWVRGLHRWHNIEPELTFRFQQILAQQLMLEVESTPTGPLLLATTSLLGRVCLSRAGELRLSIAEAILAPLAHHNLEPRMCQNLLRILAYCRSVFTVLA
jgi:hypothetical protein